MEINLPFDFSQNLRVFLQRCGYAEHNDPNTGQTSYTKRLTRDFYPRLHLYINERDGKNILNLHLDQKKPSYAGSSAHNAEYSGEMIEREVRRIQGLIKNQMDNQAQKPQDKGFWGKLFG